MRQESAHFAVRRRTIALTHVSVKWIRTRAAGLLRIRKISGRGSYNGNVTMAVLTNKFWKTHLDCVACRYSGRAETIGRAPRVFVCPNCQTKSVRRPRFVPLILFGTSLGILLAILGFAAYFLSAKHISPALALVVVAPIFIPLAFWLVPFAAPYLFTWQRRSH